MSKYQNAIYYDFKSRFLVIFSSNYRHRLVLKMPFPDHVFPKISKYPTENLHFPSTGKYYALSISNNESSIPEEDIVERGYARDWHNDSDEEWEMEGQDETRSAFDIFDDVNNVGERKLITDRTFDIKCFSYFLYFGLCI